VPGLVRIDVGNLRGSTFVSENNANFDSHAHAQWNSSQDQCPVEIHCHGLAVACKRFCKALSLEQNLQTNPSASSRFMSNWIWRRLTPAYALRPYQMIHVPEHPDPPSGTVEKPALEASALIRAPGLSMMDARDTCRRYQEARSISKSKPRHGPNSNSTSGKRANEIVTVTDKWPGF
jgi:hypothetical protein